MGDAGLVAELAIECLGLAVQGQRLVEFTSAPHRFRLAAARSGQIGGIARLLDSGNERLTSAGMSIGTAFYMSPEQFSGEKVDAVRI